MWVVSWNVNKEMEQICFRKCQTGPLNNSKPHVHHWEQWLKNLWIITYCKDLYILRNIQYFIFIYDSGYSGNVNECNNKLRKPCMWYKGYYNLSCMLFKTPWNTSMNCTVCHQAPKTLRLVWTTTASYFWATRPMRWTTRASFCGAKITQSPLTMGELE